MSDLNDILKAHDARLAASLRHSDEFDAAGAHRSVSRRRTARTVTSVVAGVAAAAAIGTGAWLAYGEFDRGPAALVSPSPSPSPSAFAPPTVSADAPIVDGCPSRAPSLTLDQARTIAAHPTTGEVWLDAPRQAQAPAHTEGIGDEYTEWYEVGSRGEHTIFAGYAFMSGVFLVEVDAQGNAQVIAQPFPEATEEPFVVEGAGLTVDRDQCYESLALPSDATVADGAPVTTHDGPTAVLTSSRDEVETFEADWGGGALYHVSTQFKEPIAAVGSTAAMPMGTAYSVRLPFGGWMRLAFDPLAQASSVVPGEWVDMYDLACGEEPTFQARVTETADSDWTVVGALGGRDVAIANAANPYAQERYQAYLDSPVPVAGGKITFDDWLALPGLVALRSDDGGWWVKLNAAVTPRNWC